MSSEVGKLVIRKIIPGKAGDNTLTPGRKFLQVMVEPLSPPDTLNTIREGSRNVWDAWLNGKTEDGFDLNINADQLFISICEHVGINDTSKLEDWTEEMFDKVIGMKVGGRIVTHYVKPYVIPNGLSKNNTRFRYTTPVFEGEDEFNIFRQQGHTIVQDEEELREIKKKAESVAEENNRARAERQRDRGVTPSGERTGTGAIVRERTVGGSSTAPELDSNKPNID